MENLPVSEYLDWINAFLNTDYKALEGLGDGVAYCKMISHIYPGSMEISDIRTDSQHGDNGYVHNFQMLESTFLELGIQPNLDLKGLISRKTEPSINFLQWYYSTVGARSKAVKCLEAAKRNKVFQKRSSDDAAKVYAAESKKKAELKELEEIARKKEKAVDKEFEMEEMLAVAVEDAMNKAIDASARVKTVAEETLNQELVDTARLTKAEIHGYDAEPVSANKDDPYTEAIQKAITSRDFAKVKIRELSEHHTKTVKSSNSLKMLAEEATINYTKQAEKTDAARKSAEYKMDQFQKAKDVLKTAKFAVAVLDAYESADKKLQANVQRDAEKALKRAEEGLDMFPIIRRTSMGLRIFNEKDTPFY